MKLLSLLFIIALIVIIHHFIDLDKKRCDKSHGLMEYQS